MNLVTADKNEKSSTSGGNSSAVSSDRYQNIINNSQLKFKAKLFGDEFCNMRAEPLQKTATSILRGRISRTPARKSGRMTT